MKKITIVTLLSLMSLFSVSSYATEDSASEGLFKDLDVDASGTISKQEAMTLTGLIDQWKELDANADDQLDMQEFMKLALNKQ